MAALTHGPAAANSASAYGDPVKAGRDRRETHGTSFDALLAALMSPAGAAPAASQASEPAVAETKVSGDLTAGDLTVGDSTAADLTADRASAPDREVPATSDDPRIESKGRLLFASEDRAGDQVSSVPSAPEEHSEPFASPSNRLSEYEFASTIVPAEPLANASPSSEPVAATPELQETPAPSVSEIANVLGHVSAKFRAAPEPNTGTISPTTVPDRAESRADPNAGSLPDAPADAKTAAPASGNPRPPALGVTGAEHDHRTIGAPAASQLESAPVDLRRQPAPMAPPAERAEPGRSAAQAGGSVSESGAASSSEPVARQGAEKVAVVRVDVSRTASARAVVTERNNAINAQMTASSERAAAMLTASIPALRRTLESLGVAANELSATTHQDGGGQSARRDQEEQPAKGADRDTRIFITREVN